MSRAMVLDEEMVSDLTNTLKSCKNELAQLRQMYIELHKAHDANTLFTINQARGYLGGISDETLLYYRRAGLPYYKKGRGSVWYRKGDIDKWLESGRVNRRSIE